jgi:putative hemolysin
MDSGTPPVEKTKQIFSLGAGKTADRLLGLAGLQRIYDARPANPDAAEFCDWALEFMRIDVEVSAPEAERIPRDGPLVVVANHPFGGIEGLILGHLLLRRRPDAKVMANYLLGRITELRDLFLLVDPFEGPGAERRNLSSMRRAIAWLEGGGALGVFPAGEVAHFDPRTRRVEDPPWSPAIARIARRVGCPVIPVHFEGRNRGLFQALGMIHPRLRTALLPREMLARQGSSVQVQIGSPIPPRRLAGFADEHETILYLRGRTSILAERTLAESGAEPVQPRVTPAHVRPVIDEVATDLLESDLAAMSSDCLLTDGKDQVVYCAEAERLPNVLREIGRLREVSFRAVGEGTGRELDLDLFDEHYLHLFIWSRVDRKIVGAYRLGPTDRLVSAAGSAGLYTSTLFDYRPDLFEEMGPALEMGRSFIRPEYQKNYAGLMLLWKGIGSFVVRNQQYTTLFGPVSISADYKSASQRLIVAFLQQNRFAHDWSARVRPREPHRPDRKTSRRLQPLQLKNLDDVSTFISEIEADNKGVPVLLKQYLKLGGRLLGFNVDPDFANVLDVLIMVDLRHTSPKILRRYLGREGTDAFHARHK